MVDQETFSRRLDALDGYLAHAMRLGETSREDFMAEPGIHDLAERYLHLIAEAVIDLANHWIAQEGLRTPETNRDTFAILEEAGEIGTDLARDLRAWAGYRNVLVHDYAVAWQAIRDDLDGIRAFRSWALGKLA